MQSVNAISDGAVRDIDDQRRLNGSNLRAGQAMFLLAAVVGVSAGLAAFVYFWVTEAAVRALVHLYQNAPSVKSRTLLILSPAVGGVLTGYLFHRFAPDAKGGGVPEVMDALLHRDGFIKLRVGFFKALASVICIGSGGSTGREGPVVQIGASVGSSLAQLFKVTRHRAQLLVACGAAAGIAAVFNAPIAGAFFAAEVITQSFEMRDLSLLFTASACSVVVARLLLWNHASFPTPAYTYVVGPSIISHFVLGVFTAVAGHFLIQTLHGVEHRFRHSRLPEVWRPALGGLMLGVLGVALNKPQVFGTGAEFMETVFNGRVFLTGSAGHIATFFAILLVAKMVATSFTLGSGGAGGDLMPAMFIGGMLGGCYGLLLHHLMPGTALPPAAFAVVGAMGVFAGIAHAPMTAIVLGIESGYNYGLVLPLLACCSVSALVSSWMRTGSVYALKLEERGIDVNAVRKAGAFPTDTLDRIRVEDVMTCVFASVPPDLTVSGLLEMFANTSHHGFVVANNDMRLLGIVTLSDTQRALEEGRAETSVERIMTEADDIVACTPLQTLRQALSALGGREVGRLPVLDPANGNRVVGVLRRGDILRGASLASGAAVPSRARPGSGK